MRIYHATSFLFRRNYAVRMFALCFGAVHIPIIGFLIFSAAVGEWDWMMFLALLAATGFGSAVAIAGLWGLLAPVTEATRTLRALRDGEAIGRIPVGGPDMAGELLETVAHAVRQTRTRLDQLQEIAESDPLTGLHNRRGFTTELVRREGVSGTLVLLDGDRFKAVNDSLGHVEGDRVLRLLALRLGDQMRPRDLVARWGGDEFTIFLEGIDRFEAERIVERIQANLRRRPVTYVDGRPLSFTAGYAALTGGSDVALGRAFEQADDDMYTRKAMHTPGYVRKGDNENEQPAASEQGVGHAD